MFFADMTEEDIRSLIEGPALAALDNAHAGIRAFKRFNEIRARAVEKYPTAADQVEAVAWLMAEHNDKYKVMTGDPVMWTGVTAEAVARAQVLDDNAAICLVQAQMMGVGGDVAVAKANRQDTVAKL